jgi:hypothetical protein
MDSVKSTGVYKWAFAPRFRRDGFGWKSDLPIKRIKEALAEIRQMARKDPVLAAEGAILLLEKLSPSLGHVDSSSGAIGSAVNRTIETLVPVIAKPEVTPAIRRRWLDRLWQAIQDDQMPYIEYLGDFWGELCLLPELASTWAEHFLPTVKSTWSPDATGHGYFKGTTACLSALYAAKRYEELLALIEQAPLKWWHDRRWGVKALVAQGKKAEALSYAEASRGRNQPDEVISQAGEEILLSSGLRDEAYRRYALQANQGSTNLNTFRAIAKKYPDKAAADILRDLVASQPGAEGKWFAAAKDVGLYSVAIDLVTHSPTDPRTLIRAAKEFAETEPPFAVAAGLAALRWIFAGHGYEITDTEIQDAYQATITASSNAGIDSHQINVDVRKLLDEHPASRHYMHHVLAPFLGSP